MFQPLIKIEGLTKHFPVEKGLISRLLTRTFKGSEKVVHAVCNVDLLIKKGETLGLVGESGSGKSTLGKCLLRLWEPTSVKVFFEGNEVNSLSASEMRKLREKMQIVFQDPFSSLNPRRRMKDIIGHQLKIRGVPNIDIKKRVTKLVETVGLSPEQMNRYPHMFSGGQKQRIAIARALITNPAFIVLDEPVSSLDVSVQAQILNLLKDLQDEYNLTYLFISHDLSVVSHMSDRIAVMYLGQIIEVAKTDNFFNSSELHPYTKALISAIPIPDPKTRSQRILIKGEIPNPINPPSGCRFHPRCPNAMEICSKEKPEMTEVEKGHFISCHLFS